MASFKLVLSHKANSDGLFSVRLRLIAERVTRYLNVPGVAISAKQWNTDATTEKKNWIRTSHREHATLNNELAALLTRARAVVVASPDLSADNFKEQMQRAGASPAPPEAASPDFLAFAYDSHARQEVGAFAVATCESRLSAINKLAQFWGWNEGKKPLPVELFTEELMADYDAWLRRELGNNPTTRYKTLKTLGLYIGRAIRRKVLPRHANPLEYYDLPTPNPSKVWLTAAELSALETVQLTPQQHLARMTYFIQYYLHGSRIGVVLRLKWKQRAHGAVRFEMDKGSTEKMIEECPQLTALLNVLLPAEGPPDPEAYVLPYLSPRYDAMSPTKALHEMKRATAVVNMNLKRAAVKAGITVKVSSHSSRRALASDADDATHDLGLVQRLLGHTSRSMTEKYTRGRDSAVVQAGAQQVYALRPMPVLTALPKEAG